MFNLNIYIMAKEAYVSFEVAKLLKEKGFDWIYRNEDRYIYGNDGKIYFIGSVYSYNYVDVPKEIFERPKVNYPCITQAVAMKWLREEKGLFVEICCDDLDYNWQILDVWHRDADEDPITKSASYGGYNEYEKAVEAACVYVLKNLI